MARLLPAGLMIDYVTHPAEWPTLIALRDGLPGDWSSEICSLGDCTM